MRNEIASELYSLIVLFTSCLEGLLRLERGSVDIGRLDIDYEVIIIFWSTS